MVNDSLGDDILKEKTYSTIKVYDKFKKCFYTRNFKNQQTSSMYRLINSDTVFQITSTSYDFSITSMQKKFEYFMLEKNYDEALNVNAQGIVLVNFVIDNKGFVVEANVLNSLHPDIDKWVSKFINYHLLPPADLRYKFEPYKKGKEKKFCEVVIPFEFGIGRFYRQSGNYSNWQIHQQMMNNTLRSSMQRGF